MRVRTDALTNNLGLTSNRCLFSTIVAIVGGSYCLHRLVSIGKFLRSPDKQQFKPATNFPCANLDCTYPPPGPSSIFPTGTRLWPRQPDQLPGGFDKHTPLLLQVRSLVDPCHQSRTSGGSTSLSDTNNTPRQPLIDIEQVLQDERIREWRRFQLE